MLEVQQVLELDLHLIIQPRVEMVITSTQRLAQNHQTPQLELLVPLLTLEEYIVSNFGTICMVHTLTA